MNDQTKWGIDIAQQANKAKAYEEQAHENDLAFFVLNCSVYQLQKMRRDEEVEEMKKVTLNVEGITQNNG